MRGPMLIAVLAVALVGCGRLNSISSSPFASMSSEPNPTAAADVRIPPLTPTRAEVRTVDQRARAERITSLEVADVQSGVLVTALGTTNRIGAFNAELVQTGRDGSTLTLEFRVQYPTENTAASNTSIRVATLLSNEDMAGIRNIRVIGANNSLSRRN